MTFERLCTYYTLGLHLTQSEEFYCETRLHQTGWNLDETTKLVVRPGTTKPERYTALSLVCRVVSSSLRPRMRLGLGIQPVLHLRLKSSIEVYAVSLKPDCSSASV
ncbi:hypothetical protein PGTUg99_035593 [Puccinia graminis f. sp. tritici]|uniref:Uncharacterized protein n=2 Tax=Puccinia graminis f. sp. tritici TaxID=56615 RepID=A0A5B0QWK1_PUCGR|nr:hypothetical protein PGTUg99_035593 [Puccinia graminis f. sp. tritici]